MEKIKKEIIETMEGFLADAQKPATNKSAQQRMRVATLKLEKLGKTFRKLSLADQ